MALSSSSKKEFSEQSETMSTTKEAMITLVSSDNKKFPVPMSVAKESQLIKELLKDSDPGTTTIPLQQVTGKILKLVISYAKKHAYFRSKNKNRNVAAASDSTAATTVVDDEGPLKKFDAKFVQVDQETLFELVRAANYLNMKGLLDLTCQSVADLMKGKSPEEVRELFKIKNDYDKDEEKKIRKENQWAFI